MANSREKGAAFERQIARELAGATGLEVRRNIEQYQKSNCPGDLVGPGVAGYAIECKRYKASKPSLVKAWREQCLSQAQGGLIPVLVVKLDRQPIEVWRHVSGEWVQQSMDDLCRELMVACGRQAAIDTGEDVAHNANHDESNGG